MSAAELPPPRVRRPARVRSGDGTRPRISRARVDGLVVLVERGYRAMLADGEPIPAYIRVTVRWVLALHRWYPIDDMRPRGRKPRNTTTTPEETP